MTRRVLFLGAIALLIGAFYAMGWGRYLSFAALHQGLLSFEQWRSASPQLAIGLFFGGYVLLVALSIPGAEVATLAAGALFGLGVGTVLVSFASSIGATLAFLSSRFLFKDAVQSRFGGRLKSINEGVANEGALYLFMLRLIPIFPFFVINLVMGLTPLRTRTFYWVSQLGMLAGTLVYVNAGTQFADIRGLSGILSPALLTAFALLGLLPLAAHRLLAWLRARRIYARWTRPRQFDRNLVVIGAGAAGLVSAYIAAAVKAKITLVEAHKMGGDCLNTGCVPSKTLIRSARVAHVVREAAAYGIETAAPTVQFQQVMARIQKVIATVAPHDSVERYTQLGVEVLSGYARIVDPWTVEVALGEGGTRRITTRSIVIAAGARPTVPPIPGLDEVGFVTSDTVWEAFAGRNEVPRRLVVLGGGPIGCELAQAFARLGAAVMQVQRASRIMTREDGEVSALAQAALERDGVVVLTGHQALRCERVGASKFMVTEHEGVERRIEFDELLCAVGREARLSGFGLEELGIETQGTVVTNEYLQTRYPNIYAAGDVAGPYQFTHAAAHQAWYAVVNALFSGVKRFKADYSVMPWTTFIDPEVARVGLNEQEARDQGIRFEVTRYDLAELDRGIADGATRGFVKVLTVPGKDRILGATLVGAHAGELLAEWVLAMRHGLGLKKILATIHTYPTLAEANKYAAGEWRRAHAPERALRWLERYHAWRRG